MLLEEGETFRFLGVFVYRERVDGTQRLESTRQTLRILLELVGLTFYNWCLCEQLAERRGRDLDGAP